MLTASPALTAILTMVLAANPRLRVRSFESRAALQAYVQIAPVDLLVCEIEDAPFARALRLISDFEIVALTRSMTRHGRDEALAAGVDEVLVKPMSPSYLTERVLKRLERRTARIAVESGYRGPDRRKPVVPLAAFRKRADNVVPLFPLGTR